MKRSLLVLSLVLIAAVPAFAQPALNATTIRLPGFGWGVCLDGYVLMGIAGDDFPGSVAHLRANIIADRIDGSVLAPASQVYLAKVCGSADYRIMAEFCDANGVLQRRTLVTIDARTSRAYGATNHQLASFWLKRLMGAQIRSWASIGETPAGTMRTLAAAMPKDIAAAYGANWRHWKGTGTISVCR